MKRVLFIIIDQLPGHWANEVNVAEGMKKLAGDWAKMINVEENVPPVNVWGYHKKGLIPNFSFLINNGIFAFAWNKGVCDTPHGMKYLATGRYNAEPFWTSLSNQSYYARKNTELIGFFEYAKHYSPEGITAACFTTNNWAAPGYFFPAADMHAFPSYFPDELMWRQFALPYLRGKKNWNLVHVYFPTMDSINNCHSYSYWNPNVYSSKHSYMLFLDNLIGEIIEFLQCNGLWEETCLLLASDHGYHAACSVARDIGIKIGINSPNWCCDHFPPYDCEIWDYKKDKSTGEYSGCTRRTLFVVSGGALGKSMRGRVVETAEIIDVVPTIADILEIPYKCEGKSILMEEET